MFCFFAIEILSDFRRHLRAGRMSWFIQGVFTRRTIVFDRKGACLLSKYYKPSLYWWTRLVVLSAGETTKGSLLESSIRWSTTIDFNDLKTTLYTGIRGRLQFQLPITTWWSLNRFETWTSDTITSSTLVISKSSVCPWIWVDPETCWCKPKSSSSVKNF